MADDIIQIRGCDHPMLAFFEMMVVCQLLAMEIAIRLVGVDVVRNKSYYSASYKHLPNI